MHPLACSLTKMAPSSSSLAPLMPLIPCEFLIISSSLQPRAYKNTGPDKTCLCPHVCQTTRCSQPLRPFAWDGAPGYWHALIHDCGTDLCMCLLFWEFRDRLSIYPLKVGYQHIYILQSFATISGSIFVCTSKVFCKLFLLLLLIGLIFPQIIIRFVVI